MLDEKVTVKCSTCGYKFETELNYVHLHKLRILNAKGESLEVFQNKQYLCVKCFGLLTIEVKNGSDS